MFKGKYIIGIYSYDKYELCETILESVIEFAEYVGIPMNNARVTLSKVLHQGLEYIIIDGKRKKIELININ